ncbi:hypothetical protein LCGC14_2912000 [marine sediment metagenome]|uniref:Uncharacterized protein n=1 Tax=marine sediment metagenome TaxID=412755 RepID=A0A0F8YD45_9ZZZZ
MTSPEISFDVIQEKLEAIGDIIKLENQYKGIVQDE